tara:strand:- start:828 stop:1247 length:420 start_codon:yes stop_codon:yes gene_type:complete
MRKNQKLECLYDYDFIVLAINSHSKAYKLCWSINKRMGLNFELTNSHKTNGGLFFKRYKSVITNGRTLNLLENRSKNGYLIPSKKQINYFLIIDKDSWFIEKEGLLSQLRAINDILLVFEFNIDSEKNSDRFIIHDKKN